MPRQQSAPREEVVCKTCGMSFVVRVSRKRKYCSRKCAGKACATKYNAARPEKICVLCGKKFKPQPSRKNAQYCGIVCSNTAKARAHSARHGDSMRGIPTGSGKSYVKEGGRHQHRVVMERELGRVLDSNELVHHLDKNIKNNQIENLQLVTRAEHLNIHRRLKRNTQQL